MSEIDLILSKATRSSGDWLPQVQDCPKRVLPCGNPRCADEAMRAASIRRSSTHGSIQAGENARKIARRCNSERIICPLTALGIENLKVLDMLIIE